MPEAKQAPVTSSRMQEREAADWTADVLLHSSSIPQNARIQQNKPATLLMFQLAGNPGCSASSSNIYPRLKCSGDGKGEMKRRIKTQRKE